MIIHFNTKPIHESNGWVLNVLQQAGINSFDEQNKNKRS